MKQIKPSVLLASIGWLSVFVMGWMLVMGKISIGVLSICFLLFYFLVALVASGVASDTKYKVKAADYEINVDGELYDEKDFIVQRMADGKIYIYLRLKRKS